MCVADLLGESSSLLDDLFKDLEDWEAILSSLPELSVVHSPESLDSDPVQSLNTIEPP